MGTDGQNDGSQDWPWSALGLAPTADKAAIHAAHDARRAELNAAAARISAFADLTGAREKALFLASELQRQQVREGMESAPDDAPHVPAPEPEPAPEPVPAPEPEPEPEPQPEPEESGGRFTSATDNLGALFVSAIQPDRRTPLPEAEGDDPCERPGRYKPDAAREHDAIVGDLAKITGLAGPHSKADGSWSGEGPTPFLKRYSLDRYGVFWLLGLMILLGMCSAR